MDTRGHFQAVICMTIPFPSVSQSDLLDLQSLFGKDNPITESPFANIMPAMRFQLILHAIHFLTIQSFAQHKVAVHDFLIFALRQLV